MRFLYVNFDFRRNFKLAQHGGQLGLLDAMVDDGDTVVYSFDPEDLFPVYDYAMSHVWDGSLKAVLERTNGPVIPTVPPLFEWFEPEILKSARDRIPFVISPAHSPASEAAYRALGIPYRCLPFGSDLGLPVYRQITPDASQPTYTWSFVGNGFHRDNWREYLGRLVAKSQAHEIPFRLIGVGWEELGIKKTILPWFQVHNAFYARSQVCPNFHCSAQKRPGISEDCNERLFDLAALGCLQVVDRFPLLDSYFDDDEIVKADAPEEWVDKVLWYGHRPEAGASFRENAARRVQAEHTWKHRLRLLKQWLQECR